jgi:hypothetical protein
MDMTDHLFIRTATVLGICLAVLAIGAPSALAGKVVANVFGEQGTAGGQFRLPEGVAVNEVTGSVYVADSAITQRVQRFSADGVFQRTWGWDVQSTPVGGPGFEICGDVLGDVCQAGTAGAAAGQLNWPTGVAAHQATGDVYVVEWLGRRISKFDADGDFLFAFGWGVDTGAAAVETCTTASGCQASPGGSAGGQFGVSQVTPGVRVAVDQSSGRVVVNDPGNSRVQVFSAAGEFLFAFGWGVDTGAQQLETCTTASGCQAGLAGSGLGQFAVNAPSRIAVGPNRIYVVDETNQRVQSFDSAGGDPVVFAPDELSGDVTPDEVFATQSDGHVFVVVERGSLEEVHVKELDAAGTLVDTHMVDAGVTASVHGLAVSESMDRIYLSHRPDTSPDEVRVVVLDDVGQPPATVTIGSVTNVGPHGAELVGTVNAGGTPATYRFEYSRNGVTWQTVPGGQTLSGDDPVDVSQAVTGLEANTFYRVRIVASKGFGGPTTTSAETTFLTDAVPPEIATGPVQHRTAASVQLLGYVNPNNLPTTYWFEYGPTAEYRSRIPVPDGDAGAGGTERRVLQKLSGLEPGRTYHYRLSARNSEGESVGVDRTFTTRPISVTPPTGRAYEMVTSPEKNNRRAQNNAPYGEGREEALVNPATVSPDGESLLLRLHIGILDPEAGTDFAHIDDAEVIRRTDQGWRAEAIDNIPSASGGTAAFALASGYSADFRVTAWTQNSRLFHPDSSGNTIRVLDDDGGFEGSGWYDWIPDLSVPTFFEPGDDLALIDDEGDRMLRWGGPSHSYRGLLGPSDASVSQYDGQAGGDAVYLQEPPGSGVPILVNECTGAGAAATEIPARDPNGTPAVLGDDILAAQPCETGEPVSRHGARVGGGGVQRVSNTLDGPLARAMSDDGSRIFFMSPDPETGFVPDQCAQLTYDNSALALGEDSRCPAQLYVRQRGPSGSVVRWISRPEVPGQEVGLLGNSIFEGASSDGRVVYFRSRSPLTADDPNGTGAPGPVTSGNSSGASWDLYRYVLPGSLADDPAEGTVTRISGGPTGDADPNTNPSERGVAARYVSDDGARAYFVTGAPISGADTTPPAGGVTTPEGTVSNPSSRNLYLYDDHQSGSARWRFVASLPHRLDGRGTCAVTGHQTAPTQNTNNGEHRVTKVTAANCMRGTPDGSAIVFESAARLTEDDLDDASDIYFYDALADELTRVSAPRTGATPYPCDRVVATGEVLLSCNADLGFEYGFRNPRDNVGLAGRRHENLAVGGDGGVAVYFESRSQLIEADDNGSRMDVYEWRDGRLSLISPGNADHDAWYSGNSRDGRDVFFQTSQRIDPREIEDADFDIYDARVGGGFASPSPSPSPCSLSTDACQGAGSAPLSTADATARTSAPHDGNATPPLRGALRIAKLTAKQRASLRRGGRASLRVTVNRPGAVVVRGTARIGKAKRRVIFAKRRAVRAGELVVPIALDAQARRALMRTGRLTVRLAVSFSGTARKVGSELRLRRRATVHTNRGGR